MPRVSFDVDDATAAEMEKIFPWGTQATIYRHVTQQLIDTVKLHGNGVLGLMLNGQFNMITQTFKKEEGKST